MEPDRQEELFESIGYYSPDDVRKLFAALAKSHIEFKADFDDGIRKAGANGGYGQLAQVHVHVDHTRIDEVRQIQTELFGDGLPNYDSSFFDKEPSVDGSKENSDANSPENT